MHDIPQGADVEKRQIAKDIIDSNNDLFRILFIMLNGDIHLQEPCSVQQIQTPSNFAFRDYFQGALRVTDIYLGNTINSLANGIRVAIVSVLVYSLKDNSTIAGVWTGSINFNVLNKELQSLNIAQSSNNARVIYVDNNDQKVADSDKYRSNIPESFANLSSFKNVINGQSGLSIDIVSNTKMMITYQPIKIFHNTWTVLLM